MFKVIVLASGNVTNLLLRTEHRTEYSDSVSCPLFSGTVTPLQVLRRETYSKHACSPNLSRMTLSTGFLLIQNHVRAVRIRTDDSESILNSKNIRCDNSRLIPDLES